MIGKQYSSARSFAKKYPHGGGNLQQGFCIFLYVCYVREKPLFMVKKIGWGITELVRKTLFSQGGPQRLAPKLPLSAEM